MNDQPWVDSLTGPMEYVPTRTAQLSPSPEHVADVLARMVRSDWPTGEEERRAWFRSFGLVDEQDLPRWGGDTEPGRVPTGWHVFEGEFVGVHWFLWEGWPRPVVEEAARDLVAAMSTAWGQPQESSERAPVGFSQLWETQGRFVEMYFYSGVPPVHVHRPDMTPSVQLHIDHAQRAEAEERVAQSEPMVGQLDQGHAKRPPGLPDGRFETDQ